MVSKISRSISEKGKIILSKSERQEGIGNGHLLIMIEYGKCQYWVANIRSGVWTW